MNLDFKKYSKYYDHENTVAMREKYHNFDYYVTADDIVRFFCVVEYFDRVLGFGAFEIVYYPGTFQSSVFDDIQQLEIIGKFMYTYGELSAKLFSRVNSKNRILTSELIEWMYARNV